MCSTNQLLQTSISYPLIFAIWFGKKYAQTSPMNFFKFILAIVNVYLTFGFFSLPLSFSSLLLHLSFYFFFPKHAHACARTHTYSNTHTVTHIHSNTHTQPINQLSIFMNPCQIFLRFIFDTTRPVCMNVRVFKLVTFSPFLLHTQTFILLHGSQNNSF